jgi:hypothetical protein
MRMHVSERRCFVAQPSTAAVVPEKCVKFEEKRKTRTRNVHPDTSSYLTTPTSLEKRAQDGIRACCIVQCAGMGRKGKRACDERNTTIERRNVFRVRVDGYLEV